VFPDPTSDSAGAGRYGGHFVDQRHATYPSAAHEVWREVLARNAALIAQYGTRMHPAYAAGMRDLALPNRVPRIEELNERLAPTGWSTVCVDGYIPSSAYAGLMSESIFPISRTVRRAEHIDFAPEPDLVHDVLGHLPMLFCAEYRLYLKRLAKVMSAADFNALDDEFFTTVRRLAATRSKVGALPCEIEEADARMLEVIQRMTDNASESTHLRRLYVWSVEFGLVGSYDNFCIHGAALLSSPAEFRAVCEGAATLRLFGLDVIEQENAFSDVLNQYFVARDFSHLEEVLSAYEQRMLQRRGRSFTSEIRELVPATTRGTD
jgi:phenylalanine-4-hydroxylase